MDAGAEILMSPRQKTLALIISTSLLILILELVRRRKLREEYSWLWLLTGLAILVLSLRYDLLVAVTTLIGAVVPVSALFFFGLILLMLISISYSVRISRLSLQVKNLAQKLTLLEAYLHDARLQETKDGD